MDNALPWSRRENQIFESRFQCLLPKIQTFRSEGVPLLYVVPTGSVQRQVRILVRCKYVRGAEMNGDERRARRRRRGGGRRRRRGRKGRKEERKKKKKGKKKKGKKKIKEMGHPPESRVRPLMTSHTIPPSPWVGSRASRLHVIDRVRQLHTIE